MGIYDALIGSYGNETDYLGQDPYFGAARSVSGWQLKPQTDSEAIWMPAMQGILAGVLGGMGRENARQSQWDELRNSPLLLALTEDKAQNLGPLASGELYASALQDYATHDYTSPDAPTGWTGKTGKSDLILAAIQQQALQEEEQKKEAARLQLENQIAGQDNAFENQIELLKMQGLVGGSDAGGAIPKALRDDLIKEKGAAVIREKEDVKVDDLFDLAKNTSRIWGATGFGQTADTLGGIGAALQTKVQTELGAEPNPDMRKRIDATVPDWNDTDSQIEQKRQRYKDIIELARKSQGTLSAALGIGQDQTKPSGVVSREEALAELRRRGKL